MTALDDAVAGFQAAVDAALEASVEAILDRVRSAAKTGGVTYSAVADPDDVPVPGTLEAGSVFQPTLWSSAVDGGVLDAFTRMLTVQIEGVHAWTPAATDRVITEHLALVRAHGGAMTREAERLIRIAQIEGWGTRQLAEEIRATGAFSPAAAEQIAQTQLTGTSGAVTYTSYELDPPESGCMEWVATKDSRTRPTHTTANGQVARVGGSFIVGGWALRYPGDPNGPASEVQRCRCALAPAKAGAQPSFADSDVADASALTMTVPDTRSAMSKPEGSTIALAADDPEGGAPTAEGGSAGDAGPGRLEGPITYEGTLTSDGRALQPGGGTWIDNPVLMFLDRNTRGGHEDAVWAGNFDSIERRPASDKSIAALEGIDGFDGTVNEIFAQGSYADTDAGRACEYAVGHGLDGISVDLDSVEVDWVPDPSFVPPDDWDEIDMLLFGPMIDVYREYRIVGATVCPFPAFQDAYVSPAAQRQKVLLASAGVKAKPRPLYARITPNGPGKFTLQGLVAAPRSKALTASGVEWRPKDSKAFEKREYSGPSPVRLEQHGDEWWLTGHVAAWDNEHIVYALQGQTVGVPRGWDDYRNLCNMAMPCADGKTAWSAPLFVNGGQHAPEGLTGEQTREWYKANGIVAAHVAMYDDEFGPQIQGVVQLGLDAFTMRTLAGNDVSPDWRDYQGQLTCYGLLSVFESGFVVPRPVGAALVASGVRQTMAYVLKIKGDRIVTALGLGMLHRDPKTQALEVLAARYGQLEDRVAAMEARHQAELDRLEAERVAELRARFGPDPEIARAAAARARFGEDPVEPETADEQLATV